MIAGRLTYKPGALESESALGSASAVGWLKSAVLPR